MNICSRCNKQMRFSGQKVSRIRVTETLHISNNWAVTRENLTVACKRASAQSDQHLVIPYLESTVISLVPCNISILLLLFVAEQTGFDLTLSETLKIGFVESSP